MKTHEERRVRRREERKKRRKNGDVVAVAGGLCRYQQQVATTQGEIRLWRKGKERKRNKQTKILSPYVELQVALLVQQ